MIFGSPKKKELDTEPTIRLFEYGNSESKQGYWSYEHMVVQLEDIIDMFHCAYGRKYDYLFMFDHSCGHDRMRENGLHVGNMNVSYGGGQKNLHNSKMIDKTYLGEFQYPNHQCPQLKVGDTQCFSFTEDDIGPYWMTPQQRNNTRNKQSKGYKTRCKFGYELKKELSEKLKRPVTGRINEIKKLAEDYEIEMTLTYEDYIDGWFCAPKGIRQVLFERGFIDINKHKNYTKNGERKIGEITIIDHNFNLTKLMEKAPDFRKELTLLQYHGKEIGIKLGLNITVDQSPKCHPEVAGEGIEYTWAQSKIYLRRLPLSKRKTKDQFRKQLDLALSEKEGACLNREFVRKTSARARDYIVAYYNLHFASDNKDKPLYCRLEKSDIEKMRRTYQCHRSIHDICNGECKQVAKEIQMMRLKEMREEE